MAPDLVYEHEMICLQAAEVIERKTNDVQRDSHTDMEKT